MESGKSDEQTQYISASGWMPVLSAVCRLGSDRYLGIYEIFDYPTNRFRDAYYGFESFHLEHTDDRVTEPFNWATL